MKRKFGKFLIFLGTVSLLAALSLLAYNKWEDWKAGQTVAEIADSLDAIIEENAAKTPAQRAAEQALAAEASTEEETEEESTSTTTMQTVTVDSYDYIGTLTIPSFGLELPVIATWSYPALRIAPCRYVGTVDGNDLVICAHNYERHFGNLKYMDAGDTLYFTDVYGEVTWYEVIEVVTLEKTSVTEMISGEWDLTLFTCTIGGQLRVTVRCMKVE